MIKLLAVFLIACLFIPTAFATGLFGFLDNGRQVLWPADVNGEDLNVGYVVVRDLNVLEDFNTVTGGFETLFADTAYITRLFSDDVNVTDFNVAGDVNATGSIEAEGCMISDCFSSLSDRDNWIDASAPTWEFNNFGINVDGDSNFASIGVLQGTYLNRLNVEGDANFQNMSLGEGKILQIGSITEWPTMSEIRFGDGNFASIYETEDDILKIRARSGFKVETRSDHGLLDLSWNVNGLDIVDMLFVTTGEGRFGSLLVTGPLTVTGDSNFANIGISGNSYTTGIAIAEQLTSTDDLQVADNGLFGGYTEINTANTKNDYLVLGGYTDDSGPPPLWEDFGGGISWEVGSGGTYSHTWVNESGSICFGLNKPVLVGDDGTTRISMAGNMYTDGLIQAGGTLQAAGGNFKVEATGETKVDADDVGVTFGEGQDASILYRNTPAQALVLDPDVVGSGKVEIAGDLNIQGAGVTEALTVHQGVDSKGFKIFGFDDKSSVYGNLRIDSVGNFFFAHHGTGANHMYFDTPGDLYFRPYGQDVFFTTGGETHIRFNMNPTYDQMGYGLRDTGGNQFIYASYSYMYKDFDHPVQPHPTLYVHSNNNPDSDNTQWLSLSHDGNTGIIESGNQDLNIIGTVNFDGNFSIKRETDNQEFVCGIDALGVLTCN